MSEKNLASPVISPSETLSTPNVDTSNRDIENQSLDEVQQAMDAATCWFTLGNNDPKHFLDHVKDDGWEKANKWLRDAVTEITTAQGLILVACAAFLTTTPPVETIDYARRRCYIWLLWSFMCSVWGLICQLIFLRLNMLLSMQHKKSKPLELPRFVVPIYLVIFSLPQYAFLLSLLFMASGIMEAILGGSSDVIFFCIVLVMGLGQRTGDMFMENTPAATVKLLGFLACLVFEVVFIIGLVCSVHIAKSG